MQKLDKPKKSIILVFTASDLGAPESRVRGQYVAQYLSEQGFKTEVIAHKNDHKSILKRIFFLSSSFVVNFLFNARRADILYLQRGVCSLPQLSLIFVILSKFMLRKKIIYDIDDGLFLKNHFSILKIIHFSDVVIVGGHELKKYIKNYNKNTFLIPTSANLSIYSTAPSKNPGVIKLGFVGSPSTTPYLNLLQEPIVELIKQFTFDISILSASSTEEYNKFNKVFGNFTLNGVKLNLIPWTVEREIDELKTLDIGLAPLTNGVWEKFKCGFKVVNYMAAGIPPVASKVGEHCYIIQDGVNGFLCADNKEWVEKLTILLTDATLRKKMALKAKMTIEEKYSLQKNVAKIKKIVDELS